jgi:hypothetical protein
MKRRVNAKNKRERYARIERGKDFSENCTTKTTTFFFDLVF